MLMQHFTMPKIVDVDKEYQRFLVLGVDTLTTEKCTEKMLYFRLIISPTNLILDNAFRFEITSKPYVIVRLVDAALSGKLQVA